MKVTNFVSKQEYENALSTIERAIGNGQLSISVNNDDEENIVLNRLLFVDKNDDEYGPRQITFVSPEQSAKNKLFLLRKELQKKREDASIQSKEIQELESVEKKLVNVLNVLKN